MTEIPEFRGFPSIARLTRGIIVTEKLDGTNAQVRVLEDGRVIAGCRTRWITPDADNYGFAQWVKDHEDELRTGLGEGAHFGEWWGQGIQRRYGMAEKRFSLFNVGRWSESTLLPHSEKREKPPQCCHVVPVLHAGNFDTADIDGILYALQRGGSIAAPGFMQPEGIVVYHSPSRTLFKKTLDKNDEHKSESQQFEQEAA